MAIEIKDSEETHRENPRTFWIPDEDKRNAIQPGEFAQMVFFEKDAGAERMWVEVTEVLPNGRYKGHLDNVPTFLDGIERHDPVEFEAKHVINILPPKKVIQ